MTTIADFIVSLVDPKGLLLIALICLPVERLLPMRPRQAVFRTGWQNDLVYFVLNRVPIAMGLILVAGLVAALSAALVPQGVRDAIASQPHWLQTIELIVLADLGFYAVHRTFHTVPWLWRFHAIHHSIRELDWLAAHRVHPIDQILTKGASMIPCFALGFSGWAIGAYFVVYQWHSLLLHSNTRIDFAPLRWVIATPIFHHWHHADHPEAWNRNFAGQLSLWDILFGTAHMPRGRVPDRYGIDDPVPNHYLAQMVYPFQRGPEPAEPEVDPSS